MLDYINEGKMVDYQDHYYPAEMSVDAQIQTFLLDGDVDKFLNKFDTDWVRYNRDIIRKVQEYEEKEGKQKPDLFINYSSDPGIVLLLQHSAID